MQTHPELKRSVGMRIIRIMPGGFGQVFPLMRALNRHTLFFRTLPGCAAALFLVALFMASWAFPAAAVDLGLVNAYHSRNVQALQRFAKTNKVSYLEPYLIARTSDDREVSEGRLAPGLVRALDLFAGVPPIEEIRADALNAWA